VRALGRIAAELVAICVGISAANRDPAKFEAADGCLSSSRHNGRAATRISQHPLMGKRTPTTKNGANKAAGLDPTDPSQAAVNVNATERRCGSAPTLNSA